MLLGGAANLVAIVANGGYMPVSPGALAAMGRLPREGYSNSRLVDGVVLGPLTDLFAMPTWVPAANVFSVGDVLIGVGAAIAVVAAMHGRGPRTDRRRPARRCVAALTRPGTAERYDRPMARSRRARPAFRVERHTLRDGPPSRANPS